MPTTIYYIYRITNTVNSKSYIGFSNNPNRRFTIHCSHALGNQDLKRTKCGLHLARAIRKYGKKSFKVNILYCSLDKEHTLNNMEEYFIRLYDTYENGYNMTYGGEGGTTREGWHWSKEGKELLSITGKLRKDVYLPKSETMKKKSSDKQGRLFLITFPDGHQETIKGLNQFCKKYHLLQSAMSSVASGKRTHHKHYKCMRITTENAL